jgi:hypothetical protein
MIWPDGKGCGWLVLLWALAGSAKPASIIAGSKLWVSKPIQNCRFIKPFSSSFSYGASKIQSRCCRASVRSSASAYPPSMNVRSKVAFADIR